MYFFCLYWISEQSSDYMSFFILFWIELLSIAQTHHQFKWLPLWGSVFILVFVLSPLIARTMSMSAIPIQRCYHSVSPSQLWKAFFHSAYSWIVVDKIASARWNGPWNWMLWSNMFSVFSKEFQKCTDIKE